MSVASEKKTWIASNQSQPHELQTSETLLGYSTPDDIFAAQQNKLNLSLTFWVSVIIHCSEKTMNIV